MVLTVVPPNFSLKSQAVIAQDQRYKPTIIKIDNLQIKLFNALITLHKTKFKLVHVSQLEFAKNEK